MLSCLRRRYVGIGVHMYRKYAHQSLSSKLIPAIFVYIKSKKTTRAISNTSNIGAVKTTKGVALTWRFDSIALVTAVDYDKVRINFQIVRIASANLTIASEEYPGHVGPYCTWPIRAMVGLGLSRRYEINSHLVIITAAYKSMRINLHGSAQQPLLFSHLRCVDVAVSPRCFFGFDTTQNCMYKVWMTMMVSVLADYMCSTKIPTYLRRQT